MTGLWAEPVMAQFKVSGRILEASTQEPLPFAVITDTLSGKAVVADLEGRYELLLNGRVVLMANYVGYRQAVVDTIISQPVNINFYLEEGVLLQEVLITADQMRIRENVTKAQMGMIEVPIEQMRTLPVFLGEMDILKSIQLLPGIQSGSEASSGFYVRGGAADQNLVLYDNVPVYNPFHAAGFISVFNMDVLNDVNVFKGGFPARLGGRISSVIDVSSKSGSMKEWSAKGGIGLITSRFTAQGPVIKDKLSVMISARTFYSYSLMRLFFPKDRKESLPVYYFYDVNARVDYQINTKNKLAFSAYTGGDKIGFVDNDIEDSARYTIPWKNHLMTAYWTYTPNNRVQTRLQAYYTRFDFSFGYRTNRADNTLNSGIRDVVLLNENRWLPNSSHTFYWGAEAGRHQYLPNVSDNDIDNVENDSLPVRKPAVNAWAMSAYMQHEWNLSSRWALNYGLRLPFFWSEGAFYMIPEPRFALKYQYDDDQSIKIAYTLMSQNVHLLSSSTASTPLDLWIPGSDTIRPQIAHQVSAGWFRNFKNDQYELNVEAFYKKLLNQIEYREGESIFRTDDYRKIITFGQGWAAGMEWLVRKRYGRFNGFAAYTLAWSRRQFDLLNNGKSYSAKFDRRHDFSLALNYQFNDQWAISALFVYGSGNFLSLPQGRFFVPGQNFTEGSYYFDYSKNNYRLRAYHRLDLGLQYKKDKQKITNEFRLDIYNVYSQLNPFFIVLTRAEDPKTNKTKIFVREYSILPIIPSLSYNIYIK
jgi:hypothetical protein